MKLGGQFSMSPPVQFLVSFDTIMADPSRQRRYVVGLDGPRRRGFRQSKLALLSQCILEDASILHDDLEVPVGVGDQVEVLQRIAVDENEVG